MTIREMLRKTLEFTEDLDQEIHVRMVTTNEHGIVVKVMKAKALYWSNSAITADFSDLKEVEF